MAKKSLADQLAEAYVQAKLATERLEELKAQAREAWEVGDEIHQGHAVIKLQRNRTWSKKMALEQYGKKVCSMQVDQKKAAKVLTGQQYEDLYVEGAAKVLVEFVD